MGSKEKKRSFWWSNRIWFLFHCTCAPRLVHVCPAITTPLFRRRGRVLYKEGCYSVSYCLQNNPRRWMSGEGVSSVISLEFTEAHFRKLRVLHRFGSYICGCHSRASLCNMKSSYFELTGCMNFILKTAQMWTVTASQRIHDRIWRRPTNGSRFEHNVMHL